MHVRGRLHRASPRIRGPRRRGLRSRALQTKLDAIASSLLEDRRGHRADAEDQLERSIGVHDQI
jgi:hypothetical protein